MTYDESVEGFERLSASDKAKEVFAHFGLAIFHAQVIEQQLINMLIIVNCFKTKFRSEDEYFRMWMD